jgi:Fic family protein
MHLLTACISGHGIKTVIDTDEYTQEWADALASRWSALYTGTVRASVLRAIAIDSQKLEGAMDTDSWYHHANVLEAAFDAGLNRQPLNVYNFLKWHAGILPYGGTLRQCAPVSVGMGDSFSPADYHDLPRLMAAFVTDFNAALARTADPLSTVAQLHFNEWQTHFFPDGNKRHCRLLTVYCCGWFDVAPVHITLEDRPAYIDALAAASISDLARLFARCQDCA